jgi:hypothetical protein
VIRVSSSQMVPANNGSNTQLPPIANQPLMSSEQQQLARNGFQNGNQKHQNLPAILHSSIGKLHMNFVQNKSLEAESRPMLGYETPTNHEVMRHESQPIGTPAQHALVSNGHLPNENGIMNGGTAVLKVAMYGEFPISTTAETQVTQTGQKQHITHQQQQKEIDFLKRPQK